MGSTASQEHPKRRWGEWAPTGLSQHLPPWPGSCSRPWRRVQSRPLHPAGVAPDPKASPREGGSVMLARDWGMKATTCPALTVVDMYSWTSLRLGKRLPANPPEQYSRWLLSTHSPPLRSPSCTGPSPRCVVAMSFNKTNSKS